MTRTRLWLTLGVLFVATSLPAGQIQNVPAIEAGDIVILGGQLFSGTGDTLVPNTGILVRRGIFLEVGTTLTGRDTSRAEIVRLAPDETVLPGFFDLHAHYAIDLFGEERVDEYTVNPIVFLANGVTSMISASASCPATSQYRPSIC